MTGAAVRDARPNTPRLLGGRRRRRGLHLPSSRRGQPPVLRLAPVDGPESAQAPRSPYRPPPDKTSRSSAHLDNFRDKDGMMPFTSLQLSCSRTDSGRGRTRVRRLRDQANCRP